MSSGCAAMAMAMADFMAVVKGCRKSQRSRKPCRQPLSQPLSNRAFFDYGFGKVCDKDAKPAATKEGSHVRESTASSSNARTRLSALREFSHPATNCTNSDPEGAKKPCARCVLGGYNFTGRTVAADLSAAKMTLWL